MKYQCLTDELWAHITEEHCELAGLRYEVLETISNPLKVIVGNEGEKKTKPCDRKRTNRR